MKLKITKRAMERAKIVGAWWRANRPEALTVFADELEWAKREMLSRPHLAPRYESASGNVFRRLLLSTSEQYVYYSVHEDLDLIIVHTVWGCSSWPRPKALRSIAAVAGAESYSC